MSTQYPYFLNVTLDDVDVLQVKCFDDNQVVEVLNQWIELHNEVEQEPVYLADPWLIVNGELVMSGLIVSRSFVIQGSYCVARVPVQPSPKPAPEVVLWSLS